MTFRKQLLRMQDNVRETGQRNPLGMHGAGMQQHYLPTIATTRSQYARPSATFAMVFRLKRGRRRPLLQTAVLVLLAATARARVVATDAGRGATEWLRGRCVLRATREPVRMNRSDAWRDRVAELLHLLAVRDLMREPIGLFCERADRSEKIGDLGTSSAPFIGR